VLDQKFYLVSLPPPPLEFDPWGKTKIPFITVKQGKQGKSQIPFITENREGNKLFLKITLRRLTNNEH
jgi:hypothetical protein